MRRNVFLMTLAVVGFMATFQLTKMTRRAHRLDGGVRARADVRSVPLTPAPDPPKVSVIVLPRTGERLRRCIESIRILTPYPDMEIIVLDDGAVRPPMRQLLHERTGWITVVENRQDLSDSAQRNVAAKAATGEVLCFVTDDIEVLSDSWLHELVGPLMYPRIGCVGAKLLYRVD